MKAEYSLPVKVKIDAENPDAVAIGLAKAMYDAIELYLALNVTGQTDVEYTIYKKPDVDTFGRAAFASKADRKRWISEVTNLRMQDMREKRND